MPRDKAILKEQLAQLSKKELAEMVLKLAGKRYNYEFLLVNFLDKDGGEQTLFDKTKEEIDILCLKEFKGRTIQHQLVKKLNSFHTIILIISDNCNCLIYSNMIVQFLSLKITHFL